MGAVVVSKNIKKSLYKGHRKSKSAAERLYDTYLALGYSSHEAIQAINKIYEKHNKPKGAEKC